MGIINVKQREGPFHKTVKGRHPLLAVDNVVGFPCQSRRFCFLVMEIVRRQNKWDRMGAFEACSLGRCSAQAVLRCAVLRSARLLRFTSCLVASMASRFPWHMSAGVTFAKAS